MLKDDNPDKGTETSDNRFIRASLNSKLKDDNPDKGTETHGIKFDTVTNI